LTKLQRPLQILDLKLKTDGQPIEDDSQSVEPLTKPDGLSADASAHWDLIVTQKRGSQLQPQETGKLIMLCEIFARWQAAQRQIATDGLTTMSAAGTLKRHPALAIAEKAETEYRLAAAAVGLTPTSDDRKRESRSDDRDNNPFA
jgi:P27 family predicted phage terminase small subunit